MTKTPTTESHARSQTRHSYLLRLWPAGTGAWHASLQNVRTGDEHRFDTLRDLLAFIEDEAGEVSEKD